ncbi:3-isopropylmalate dehydratase [Sphingobium sp. Leaf26]|uniref:3-isopropylmalate dehydratase small subunit n=1 Tax=Sphingobium sp. Leaf26 TaxID=1735693 RepID=UPI0006FC214B|nr:3-isopropylmalate dehydratase small subunit [Sphingobium sp. Leaf26]KQN00654.1 3-isopropylmalate dehydratase [Sphingobium sp. Leaf26]
MRPFRSVTGIAVPFGAKNVDTDIIIPSRWLKVITRTGLGQGAFEQLRADQANIFDQPRYAGAPILIAGENFGCGSSREHAPWALLDMGFRAVIAPSFADIFSSNSAKNGLALIALPQEAIDRLLAAAQDGTVTVDLEANQVTTDAGDRFPFVMDAFRRHCLLEGLDEIGLIAQREAEIVAHETRLRSERRWVGVQ